VFVVAQAKHLRQRDQSQKDNLAADDAGHCRHDDRHDRRYDRDPTAHSAHGDVKRIVHVLGDAGTFEQRSHHDEERHSNDGVGNDEVVDPLHHQSEAGFAEIQPNDNRP